MFPRIVKFNFRRNYLQHPLNYLQYVHWDYSQSSKLKFFTFDKISPN